ncbi:hypothetical protein GWK08_12275 [Leptobacterium flavescens]|uniref:Uncharacterized protein n=1 Tax=Leptobacterium flavescens TaxID=472055 RepID=A0A6P0ULK0_9FLAO|nr:hypothetical protein [Leptobacterium flavescens]NER14221.1 hypothetical protein [Leptobacterium flavescens]
MKRVYKIIILFVVIFLIGVFSFAGYINYSLKKNDELKAVDSSKTSKKGSAKTTYLN